MDPQHRYRRLEVGDAIYDYNEPGLVVTFSMLDDEPLLTAFFDLWYR